MTLMPHVVATPPSQRPENRPEKSSGGGPLEPPHQPVLEPRVRDGEQGMGHLPMSMWYGV